MPRARVCLLAVVVVASASGAWSSIAAQQVDVFQRAITQLGPNVPPPRDAKPVVGRSAVRGRVLAADSGQPVRRATVAIRAPELRVPRTTMTDADGRYEFHELPAGRYSINASKTPFVGWSYGQTQPGSPGKPLVLADNQTADSINIALPRGAVITGTITDDLGEPVPNASVNLLRPQFIQGQQRLMPAGAASFPSTNDIGEYRMFGLPPGQYYVAAQPQQQVFSSLGPNGQVEGQEARNGYARTFYPGTADVSGAQKITVGLGQTISEMNIVLLPTRLATISGVAVDSQGQVLGGGFVQLMPRGGLFVGGISGGPLSADGTFRVPNVAPGLYTLRANSPRTQPAPGAPPLPPEVSVAVVTVDGEDVTDLRLMPVQPVAVRGQVSFDDSAAAQAVNPSTVRVMTQALNVDDFSIGFGGAAGGPATLADDFTFELKIPPGRVGLRAMVQSAPTASTGWQVKAVRVNGTDVTDSGIEVDARGADGIEIELTNRRQEISGAVTDAGSAPVEDYTVIVFAQDRARWAAPFNRYFGMGRPGDDGRFRVGALPPGDYYAIALDRVDPPQSQDPEFLEGLSRQASSFSLSPGDTRTLDLRLFTVQ